VGEGGTIEKVNRTHSQNETPSNCGGWGFLSYWKLPSHDLTLTAYQTAFSTFTTIAIAFRLERAITTVLAPTKMTYERLTEVISDRDTNKRF
jgi:hypothetical protein